MWYSTVLKKYDLQKTKVHLPVHDTPFLQSVYVEVTNKINKKLIRKYTITYKLTRDVSVNTSSGLVDALPFCIQQYTILN